MSEQGRELRGWDEICAYLNLSRRTAQNYERTRHLPVRRLDGPRGRVLAYASELDLWKTKYYSLPEVPEPETDCEDPTPEPSDELQRVSDAPPPKQGGSWRKYFHIAAAVSVAGALVAAAVLLISPSGPPSSFRTNSQNLIALDRRERILWQFRFPAPLMDIYGSHPGSEWLWTGNLDEDLETETLFRYDPMTWHSAGGHLFCFSQQGKVKWKFTPGRKVTDSTGFNYEVYGAGPFRTLAPSRKHSARVVISSAHVNSFPNQIAVLDGNGRIVGEYWHSGHVFILAVADLDGDGIEEILAGGVNNGYRKATVVVFDPRQVHGASAQAAGDTSQLIGFGPGTEKAVLRFPRSCIVELLEPFNRVISLLARNSGLEVQVSESHKTDGPYLIYDFDRSLALKKLTVSDMFLNRHRELESTGQLRHSFTDKERRALEQGVEVLWGEGSK